MKTVLVDMDSILADFYFGILEAYKAETGLEAPVDCLKDWNSVLPNGKDTDSYFKQPGFFRNLKPIPGAIDGVRALKEAGHDVLICTACIITDGPGEKYEWLSEHMPWFDRRQVIFAKRKELVMADLLIDDHGANAAAFLRRQPSSAVIGIEYPYNQGAAQAFTHLVPSYLDFPEAWRQVLNLSLEVLRR